MPAYNPTVVYGAWAYPAYPPYPVYPPGYVATTAAFSFMAGAAVGAAWGYAWGHANWHGGDVNINVNQNTNINNNINREKYATSIRGKVRPARANGSMTPATGVESPTRIREPPRSTTRGQAAKLRSPGRPIEGRPARVQEALQRSRRCRRPSRNDGSWRTGRYCGNWRPWW